MMMTSLYWSVGVVDVVEWACALCGCRIQNTEVVQMQPLYSPNLAPSDFWLFPKLKSPLKGKRFQTQTVSELQENVTGQLMAIGRTVWRPKVPTLKGTEAGLSDVQYFLYFVSSSINVSIFHITWLNPFWTDLKFISGRFSVKRKLSINNLQEPYLR